MSRPVITRRTAGALRTAVLIWLVALAVSLGAPATSPAANQKQKGGKQKQEAYALLAGSVFDETGRRVPGVEIRVREKDGKRHWEAETDATGEFAVRLPAATAG